MECYQETDCKIEINHCRRQENNCFKNSKTLTAENAEKTQRTQRIDEW